MNQNQVQENCLEISKQAEAKNGTMEIGKKIKLDLVEKINKSISKPEYFCRICKTFSDKQKWSPNVCDACYVQNETL